MSLLLEKPYPRLWSILSGTIMVVADLHGNWELYQGYRDRFIDLYQRGEIDGIVFIGDLIHSDSEGIPDKSLEIVLDVLQLNATFGDDVIYLCGNHELPHILGFGMASGNRIFTRPFEVSLSQTPYRSEVIGLFKSLPFYLRTASGVTITHAGAIPEMADREISLKVLNWDYESCLARANEQLVEMGVEGMRRAYAKLSGVETYTELAQEYLAVSGEDDPRYDDLLRGFFVTMESDFKILRSALFTKCESEFGDEAYSLAVEGMLKQFSVGFRQQYFLVAGHMNVSGSYQIVGNNHFRFASGKHATPVEAGKFLVLDTKNQINRIEELVEQLYSV